MKFGGKAKHFACMHMKMNLIWVPVDVVERGMMENGGGARSTSANVIDSSSGKWQVACGFCGMATLLQQHHGAST